MKCQQCEKPATFHITELTGPEPQEVHLCEGCAKTYLLQGDGTPPAAAPTAANLLAKQLKLGQAAEELAKLDKRACPKCGITFYEFRNQGRHDVGHDLAHGNPAQPLAPQARRLDEIHHHDIDGGGARQADGDVVRVR